ncbi:MAG: hypothetical protein P1U74_10825 [Legionellaceae bacterium]|nr:hypothetical protein [Legionellaceae bacterium]
MIAKKNKKASKSKSAQNDGSSSASNKKLEVRRRIEDLYEEKRLREELEFEM